MWHTELTLGAISLAGRERRPLRLVASDVGHARPVRAVALGVRPPARCRRHLMSGAGGDLAPGRPAPLDYSADVYRPRRAVNVRAAVWSARPRPGSLGGSPTALSGRRGTSHRSLRRERDGRPTT